MNESFAGWVYPTLRYVLDALGIDRKSGRVRMTEREFHTLKERLAEMEFSGRNSPDHEVAKAALIPWIDEKFSRATAGKRSSTEHAEEDVAVDSGNDGSKFFEDSMQVRGIQLPDAAETFYLCAALGYRGRYPSNLEDLPPSFEDWVRLFLRKIDPKLPDRFDPIAVGETYDPDVDALPLIGHRFLKRSIVVLVVSGILAVVSLGLWIYLRNE